MQDQTAHTAQMQPAFPGLDSENLRRIVEEYLRRQQRLPRRKTKTDLKELFDVIDEEELAELADVEVQTVRQWRTRRIGPMYIQIGKARLYFKRDVIDWMKSIRKETAEFDMKVAI